MFFSVIVPCYNSSKRIKRLLDSFTRQGIGKEDLQVIFIDDNSNDGWDSVLVDYDDLLAYEYHRINPKMHCPNNTRKAGMQYVKGEWLFFADHDDFLEDNALSQVKGYIISNQVKECLCTNFRGYNEGTNEYTQLYIHKNGWTHGKFYNTAWLKKHNVNYIDNLYTHEDIFFDSCVMAAFMEDCKCWEWFEIYTYVWVEVKDSVSRTRMNKRGLLHDNFEDYITSASYPFWDLALKGNPDGINQLLVTLLHCYFYYEGASYNLGASQIQDNKEAIVNLLNEIKTRLQFTNEFIIDYIYSDPIKYEKIRRDCFISEGIFVEKTSFRDFVFRLGGNPEKTALGKSSIAD